VDAEAGIWDQAINRMYILFRDIVDEIPQERFKP
jgi:hypothetical protein